MNQINTTKKTKKIWSIVLWVVAGLVVLAGLVYVGVVLWSRSAVDSYRQDAANQLNTLIASDKPQTNVEAVKLQSVPLADFVNSKYKNIDDLQSQYQTLLNDVVNYLATLSAHNEFVRQYNQTLDSISKDDAAASDVSAQLKTLSQKITDYATVYAKTYPYQKDQVQKLNDLASQCETAAGEVANGDISAAQAVMNAGSSVIQAYEDALQSERTKIDQDLADFQNKINQ